VSPRLVIVDDCVRFRAAAVELLTERGFEVLGAVADAEEALAAVAGRCPDGILLDVNLGRQDGFVVSAALAAACPGAGIVLTSASVDHVPEGVLRACGAVAFVPKEALAVADLDALFRLAST
jgi:DNA-binding NarL/FixJ family response regulator